jgi:hypothetical protein
MFGWTRIATLAAVAAVLAMATGVAGATSKPGGISGAGSHLTRAGKVTSSAATRAALLKAANLRTRAAAARYLRSIGLKASHLVIQRGIRNYAGANCPGKSWSCTSTAHPVVQIASAGGSNTFQCETASCAVVQVSAAGSKPNSGTCIKMTGLTQSCSITQTGGGMAVVYQSAGKSMGLTQTASQTASITQRATGTTNTACVTQAVNIDGSTNLSAKKGAPINVGLEAHQSIAITQDATGSGANFASQAADSSGGCTGSSIAQTQTLSSTATGSGTIIQNENAANSGANMTLDIEQNQGAAHGQANGPNTAMFNQTNSLTAIANGPGTESQPVSQTQSSANGGILGTVNQDSSGVSTATATQTETQCEDAEPSGLTTCDTADADAPSGYALTQTQYGPVKKGVGTATQTGNSGDTFTVTQSSRQDNDGTQTQPNTVQGDCTTSGNCVVSQTVTDTGTTTTNTKAGSSVNTSVDCTSSCTTTTTSGTTPITSGDILVSVGNGLVQERTPTGTLVQTLDTGKGASVETAGLAFDAAKNLYVTDFEANDVSKFNHNGALVGSFGSGYDSHPESIVFDSSGNAYVGQADSLKKVLKFSPTGASLASFAPATENRGTDWIDLGPDGCTLYYTSEGTTVKRFDVCTNLQLGDFATGLPGTDAFAIKLLPGGGALVADADRIVRLDATGTDVQDYVTSGTGVLFSLALDPSGTSFWAGDLSTGKVTKFDLSTGAVLTSFNTGGTSGDNAGGIAIAP